MFSKQKLRNGFQEIVLVDFVGHLFKTVITFNSYSIFFFTNIYFSVIVCMFLCIMYFVHWRKLAIWYAIVFFNFLQYLSIKKLSTLNKLVNK